MPVGSPPQRAAHCSWHGDDVVVTGDKGTCEFWEALKTSKSFYDRGDGWEDTDFVQTGIRVTQLEDSTAMQHLSATTTKILPVALPSRPRDPDTAFLCASQNTACRAVLGMLA